jgi:NAD-dependent dihydropyrimidine dehydrogenase PreA subunit
MRACPGIALQPAVAQADWEGVFTPVLVPAVGFCNQDCNVCGEVCPTGALQPFTMEEKPALQMGLAEIDRDLCLSWRRGGEYRHCLVCDEVCPYGAATAVQRGRRLRPVVIADKCTGCGQCENRCPATPVRAIKVFRREEG